MTNKNDLITVDELEQINIESGIKCPFCASVKVYPVVGKGVKIKNKYSPYQKVEIPNIDGLYCVDCKIAYAGGVSLDKVIQECRDISGDPNFYPSEGKENIDEESV